jgi:hypothetical protein
MIHRIGGNVCFECDSCGENYDSQTNEFHAAWAEAKDLGWRSRKIGQDWVHSCPDCEATKD